MTAATLILSGTSDSDHACLAARAPQSQTGQAGVSGLQDSFFETRTFRRKRHELDSLHLDGHLPHYPTPFYYLRLRRTEMGYG
ncbi:hypothetical protein AVEN_217552-1 [Araneus ventricosus]|uniref:Uncharacterized protein n=1 Tax=Araneus ventricosus TaxID=182803 RepID=A0A4Y2TU35_ARAVE|nr:hypothetical protein AVEN_217552-1 [Araneus ventricosus]